MFILAPTFMIIAICLCVFILVCSQHRQRKVAMYSDKRKNYGTPALLSPAIAFLMS